MKNSGDYSYTNKKIKKQYTCRKRRFRDKREAMNALILITREGGRDRTPIRCYECEKCKGWHLTSQEEWGKKFSET